ncbi:acyltransferase [Mycolicibacterium sp. 018/SC-01/001]|uniref:acyltransferase n=1 Tax=Mycolicibacterium sp. 018/SC-01/001 TaxID=2592069 RepID=UPI00117DB989|nr:acyltransferase [Mycolicibacterium sp. 018/SC-01/001]TRW80491.1 acyltransferase [Mycolicibacterium sp. 018/SC-01/001]
MAELERGSLREKLGERLYNNIVTHIPFHFVRQFVLRFGGAKIGRNSSILVGSTVLGLASLEIGDCCSIGFRVLLDARGGLVIEDSCVLASDVQIITGKHIIDSDDFGIEMGPVRIGHHAWIASRATVLQDVTIGVGAVVGACSLVNSDVDDMAVVAGVPARVLGKRNSSLNYRPKWRPLLY